MRKNDNKENDFLSLLRSGLWGYPVCADLSDQEWYEIHELANSHAVGAVVFDAVAMMENSSQPECGLKMRWISETILLEKWNCRMDKEISSLIGLMEKSGINCQLFKGRAISDCYLNPYRRTSGDVDLFFEGENYYKAICWAEERRMKFVSREGGKHVVIYYRGILWEFHYTLLILSLRFLDKRFKRIFLSIRDLSPRRVVLNNCIVQTFEPTFNVLYIFIHIFKHAQNCGIGLRHYCDLSRVIWNDRELIEWARLERYLSLLYLRKCFLACWALMVDYLGLPEHEFFIKLSPRDHKNGAVLLKSTMESGNFGVLRHKTGVTGLIRKFNTFIYISRITIRFARIAPFESPFNLFARIKAFLFSH